MAELLVIEKDPWGGPYAHLARQRVADPSELAGAWVVVLAGPRAADQKHVTEAFRAARDLGVKLAVLRVDEPGQEVWFDALEERAQVPRTLGVRDGAVVVDLPGARPASVIASKLRDAGLR